MVNHRFHELKLIIGICFREKPMIRIIVQVFLGKSSVDGTLGSSSLGYSRCYWS